MYFATNRSSEIISSYFIHLKFCINYLFPDNGFFFQIPTIGTEIARLSVVYLIDNSGWS